MRISISFALVLGAVKTGSGDANTIDDEWHMCSNNVSNVPTTYGLLHTKKYSDALFMQEYFSTVDKQSYTRTYYSGQWHDWTSLNSFGCSTASELASLLGGTWGTNTLFYICNSTQNKCIRITAPSNIWSGKVQLIFDVNFHGWGQTANARVVVNGSGKITAIQFGTIANDRIVSVAQYGNYGCYIKHSYCEGVYIQVRANVPTIEVVDIPSDVSFTNATVIQ